MVFIDNDYEEEDLPPPPPRPRFRPGAVLFAFLVAISAMIVWLARPPQDVLADPASLLKNFEMIAFGRTDELRIWRTPLRIALRGDGVEDFRPIVIEAAALFASFTSLDAQVLPAEAESFNLLVEMVSPADYPMIAARFGARIDDAGYLAEHALCYTVSTQGVQNPRQMRATVAIPNDLAPGEIPTCIWHEMMHAFGFQSHPEPMFFSVLREGRRPTKNDLVLLRTLYDVRLGQGSRAQMMANARGLIEEHARAGRLSAD